MLDTCFIEALPCIQGEIPLFTTALGVFFKLIHVDPNSRISRKPMLRMLQYYEDQIIAYIDSCNNIYNSCTFNNAQEGSLTWFPCLTKNESREGRSQIIATTSSSTQRNLELKIQRVLSHLSKEIEEPRKGGAPQEFRREPKFSNATPKNEKSPCTDIKGIYYRQTCHDCDVNHLKKDCPYSHIPNQQAMMLSSMHIVENRVNHSLNSFHIKIALMCERKKIFDIDKAMSWIYNFDSHNSRPTTNVMYVLCG